MPLQQDLLTRIVNVHVPKRGCRFAVCGYDGNFADPFELPAYFGVGAYSDDGKVWTPFTAFANGSMVIAFNMRDPNNTKQNIVVAGGCVNHEGNPWTSTALLKTIVGSVNVSANGGTLPGANTTSFGSIGYNKDTKEMYAVDNTNNALYNFPIGTPPDSEVPPDEQTVFWAGAHYPAISPVNDCSTTPTDKMTYKGKDGEKRTLAVDGGALKLDGTDMPLPEENSVIVSAAGGLNDKGEEIIIAVGYTGEEGKPIAWWSIESMEGRTWNTISGLWSTENIALQAAQMAVAVPTVAPPR